MNTSYYVGEKHKDEEMHNNTNTHIYFNDNHLIVLIEYFLFYRWLSNAYTNNAFKFKNP